MGTRNLSIRREVQLGFPHAPKGCCIQLEKVAQQRILENINSQLKGLSYYLETIRELYEITGSVPTLAEFSKLPASIPTFFIMGSEPTQGCS